jgi:predicted acylesterase/phospholipase RssA
MNVLISPVSGGGFVVQLAIMQHLCEMNYIPDVVLASSGGNVAAYIAAAADWKAAAIERFASGLKSNMFLSPWNSVSSVSSIVGYFKGDMYNKGDGVVEFMKTLFTPKSITKYEIWTGTYNRNKKKARVFCNKDERSCLLNISSTDCGLLQLMPPIYANGNIELIAEFSIASASIPTIVPPQIIDGDEYIDGGVVAVSPLVYMKSAILEAVGNDGLHMVYVSPDNIENPVMTTGTNLVDSYKKVAAEFMVAQAIKDRLTAHDILKSFPGSTQKAQFDCNYQNLQHVISLQNYIKYSLIEIYPLNPIAIDFTNFSSVDITNAVTNTFGSCRCRLWYQVLDNDDAGNIAYIVSQFTLSSNSLASPASSSNTSTTPNSALSLSEAST